MSTEKEDSGNKVLVGVLIFLCVVIVGLGVGIGVVIIGDANKISYEDCMKDLDNILKLSDGKNIQEVIDAFQLCIDVGDNDLALYGERASWVTSHDYDRLFGDVVISDSIKCDEILLSQTSAADVFNYASYYNDDAVMEKYNDIIVERVEADGFDYYGGGSEG